MTNHGLAVRVKGADVDGGKAPRRRSMFVDIHRQLESGQNVVEYLSDDREGIMRETYNAASPYAGRMQKDRKTKNYSRVPAYHNINIFSRGISSTSLALALFLALVLAQALALA